MLPARHQMLHRFADANSSSAAPLSYNRNDHSVEAVISMGSPVKRAYGTEVLRISPRAVDLSRLHEGGIPFLDHHNQSGIDQVLGRIADAWIDQGALRGRIVFAQTPQGKKAEGMVARGEIGGISAGYRVDAWEITDEEGDVVDERNVRWDDDLTFTAIKWQLFEASLVGVPADGASMIRSLGGRDELADIRARVLCRHKMMLRSCMLRGE